RGDRMTRAPLHRRSFLTLLGGAPAAAWPVAARAQQREPVRRIGVLYGGVEGDPVLQGNLAKVRQRLAQLGWTEGRNVRFDLRWGGGNRDVIRKYASELVALKPDVILASGGGAVGPLQQETRTIPIVFVSVVDPIAGGFVESLARPGGNATGFTE